MGLLNRLIYSVQMGLMILNLQKLAKTFLIPLSLNCVHIFLHTLSVEKIPVVM